MICHLWVHYPPVFSVFQGPMSNCVIAFFSVFPHVSHLFHYIFLPPDGGKGKENKGSVTVVAGVVAGMVWW